MSLIALTDVCLNFVDRPLFDRIGFQVEAGDRIGLVGRNGSGKTTLLRVLCGEIAPDSGEVGVGNGTRIGYLPQDIQEGLEGPILQAILDSVPDLANIRGEIERLEGELNKGASREDQEWLAVRLAERHQELLDIERRFPPHNAEKILEGLGFKSEDFERPFSALSGGWKMRAVLGGMLYRNPDVLLLDEPTNHLDIPSVRWLEQFLQGYKGAMVLVCHDKDFLNRQVDRIVSFETEGMRRYSGNFESYVRAREEENRLLEARARNQEMKVKEARKFINRFKAKASKARQAQSKIKLVKKMELVQTHRKEKSIHFSFPEVTRSGKTAVQFEGVEKGFGGRLLYRDLNLNVLRGERVGIIGPNGAGKTTLLKMAAGELEPDKGRIVLGHGVSLSYYAQHLSEILDPHKSILEEVYQVVPHETISFVRGVCGAFLFSGRDVDKKIRVLSGGERARVCLAKILLKPGNLLIMDEPTNHLDLISSEILIKALADYTGTLVFVSHNQSFVNGLATKIWDIRDCEIVEYPGGLYEYYDHAAGSEEEIRVREEGQAPGYSRRGVDEKEISSKKELRREKAEKRKTASAALKPIQFDLEKLEERIASLEDRQKDLEAVLADPEVFRNKDKGVPLLSEYNEIRRKIDELMLRWEYKHLELESAKEEMEKA